MKSFNYSESDFQAVIEFLGNLYALDPEHPYWLPGRWEYATYLVSPLHLKRGNADWKKYIRIWKEGKKIIGIVHSENPDNNVFIHVHPEYQFITAELIDWAEVNISQDMIQIWALKGNLPLENLLLQRQYQASSPSEYLNWCDLADYKIRLEIPSDYQIKSLEDETYLDSKIECTAQAFISEKVSRQIYAYMQTAPSYQRSFDLFVVHKQQVVSMCIIWQDKVNSLGYIEPVATHPDFQRKGLGKALLNFGMRQLKESGFARAYVGAYGDDRKAFYYKSGFTNSVTIQPWTKVR